MAFLQISRFLRRSLFGDLLEVGVPEPAEYATLRREHEDYLRAQVAHR
jgi:hypothetical protein